MKISIGINNYRTEDKFEPRQQWCVESLRKIQSLYPDVVTLYNVTHTNEDLPLEGFKQLNKLTKSTVDIIENYWENLIREYPDTLKEEVHAYKKELPSVKEVFDVLSETDCDYFIFLNDDIIMSDRFIEQMLSKNGTYDCFPASRFHLYNFKGLKDTSFINQSYSVHGFDAFGLKKEWWKKHHYNFPNYLLGKAYWDTHYFTLCQLFGDTFTLNKLPPVIFHPEHSSDSCTQEDAALKHNTDIFNRALIIQSLWFDYVYKVLLNRKPLGECKWGTPFENEVELEKAFFEKKVNLCKGEPIVTSRHIPTATTMCKDVDVFVPCAPKDYIKMPYAIKSLIKNLKGVKDIHICTPDVIPKLDIDYPIYYHLDKEVLTNVDPYKWKFRPNWIYQQMIKLFQEVTSTEYYLTYDVDGILNRPLDLFDGDKPIWYYGWPQNEIQYMLFNYYMVGLEKVAPTTFIGDLCFFNKTIIKDMLERYGHDVQSFLDKSYKMVQFPCHIGEPELYGNYAASYYPDLYQMRKIKQYHYGKYQNDASVVNWTKDEIDNLLATYKDKDYDIIQMHSWCADTKDHWKK